MGGLSLYVVERGRGPSLLLIHGGAEDADSYARIARLLASDLTTITYDRRGTSRSDRGSGWPRLGVERHADDAAALLRELGRAPATCWGASSGAVIALVLALRHPELVRRLLLFEPALPRLASQGAQRCMRLRIAMQDAVEAHGGDHRAGYDEFARTAHGAAWDALPGKVREREMNNAEVFMNDDFDLISRYEMDTAAALTVPATVVTGKSSSLLAEAGRRLAARVGADAVSLDVGHGVHREDPQVLARFIRQHACPAGPHACRP